MENKYKTESNNSNYSTSSFYLACFLISKGVQMIGVEPTGGTRCQFILANNPSLKKFVNSYQYSSKDDPSVLVDAREFANSVRELKDRLYQTKEALHAE